MEIFLFLSFPVVVLLVLVAQLNTADEQYRRIKEVVAVSAQETVDAVVAQLAKAKGEILLRVEELQAELAAAGVAEQVDLSALVEAAQALDDVVPDSSPDVEESVAPAVEEASDEG